MAARIEALRTLEERFAVLPNFPYRPRYIEDLSGFEGLRLHYVDEGPSDAENVFFCLHGERAREFLANRWEGETFIAVGMQDIVLGPPVMEEVRSTIRGCPPPLEIPDANPFVQEWGDQVARAALEAFGLTATG